MWLRMTPHFKDKFPIDVGGLVFAGYNPKQTNDEFGQRLAAQNFPWCVPCTPEGEYLVDVPPVKTLQLVAEAVVPPVSLPKKEEAEAVADTAAPEEDQPVVEEVTHTRKTKKST
jgi:hypothetical protein